MPARSSYLQKGKGEIMKETVIFGIGVLAGGAATYYLFAEHFANKVATKVANGINSVGTYAAKVAEKL
jgi:hypothetical protein